MFPSVPLDFAWLGASDGHWQMRRMCLLDMACFALLLQFSCRRTMLPHASIPFPQLGAIPSLQAEVSRMMDIIIHSLYSNKVCMQGLEARAAMAVAASKGGHGGGAVPLHSMAPRPADAPGP